MNDPASTDHSTWPMVRARFRPAGIKPGAKVPFCPVSQVGSTPPLPGDIRIEDRNLHFPLLTRRAYAHLWIPACARLTARSALPDGHACESGHPEKLRGMHHFTHNAYIQFGSRQPAIPRHSSTCGRKFSPPCHPEPFMPQDKLREGSRCQNRRCFAQFTLRDAGLSMTDGVVIFPAVY
jgi:hypothetical protein